MSDVDFLKQIGAAASLDDCRRLGVDAHRMQRDGLVVIVGDLVIPTAHGFALVLEDEE